MDRAKHASIHHKGRIMSKEWKAKIGKSVKKTHWSRNPEKRDATIKKMSKSLKGRTVWNKGLKNKHRGIKSI